LIFTVFFDALRNVPSRPERRRLGHFEAVGCERTVGVALGFVLLDVSWLAPCPGRRMQGDMAALMGKDVELLRVVPVGARM
jgi:hypothetical protein